MSQNSQLFRKVVVSILPALAMVALLTWLYFGARDGEKAPSALDGETESQVRVSPLSPAEDGSGAEPQADAAPSSKLASEQHAQEAGDLLVPAEAVPAEQSPSLADISDAPLWKQLIDGDFAARFITLLDEVNMGFIPVKSLGAFKSDSDFVAVEENDEWFLTPETEARYTPCVELFCTIDTELAGKVYRAIKPALQNALNVSGHPDQTPDQLLLAAMEKLRQIPLYESNPPMNKVADGLFAWKYPDLEALSPAQKTLLRMGQGNLRKIREKAEQLIVEVQ